MFIEYLDYDNYTEFVADDRSVAVNEGDTQTALTLTVERVGGAVGVVQVVWNLTRSNGKFSQLRNNNSTSINSKYSIFPSHHSTSVGGDPSDDILPNSGSLQFITNARQQTITLTILPDNLPEVDEVRLAIIV